jgi:hypothetical protein
MAWAQEWPNCSASAERTDRGQGYGRPRLSACGIPLKASGLKLLWRHREPVMHRCAEGEHERLGDVRYLAHVSQVIDHQRSPAYPVVGEVDDLRFDRTDHLADLRPCGAVADVGVERLQREIDLDDEFS